MPDTPNAALVPEQIFTLLGDEGVDYVLIGGLAVIVHGSTRTTQDVDIIPRPDRTNLEALARTLQRLDAKLAGADAHLLGISLDVESLAAGGNFTLDTRAGGFDVMQDVPGAAAYDELRRRALVVDAYGTRIPTASRTDLIAMKRASGRDKDRADIVSLTAPVE
jgi:hypothetical protein